MRLEIKEKSKTIEMELEPITQLCGVNFRTKSLIIQSLVKHFSGYKYKDYEEALINNVLWNGEVIGRKYFSVIHITNRESLIKALSVAKLSVVFDYLVFTIAKLDCQESLEQLEGVLENVVGKLNAAMHEDGIGLELSFEEKSIIEIVQNSVLRGQSGKVLEELDSEELLDNFLHVLEAVQQASPKKQLIIIENIDHMVGMDYYEKFCERASGIGEQQDINFLVTTSIKNYVVVNRKFLSGIMVVNDEIFSFPEWEHLQDFLERNYPCQFKLSEEECFDDLRVVAQEIGRKACEVNIRSAVVLKLINRVMGMDVEKVHFVNDLERNYILNI